MPPLLHELPYRSDSSRLFERVAHEPWAVFLDSAKPFSEQGRYDIIAAAPWKTLVTWGTVTEIRSADSREQSGEDPFQLLKRELGDARCAADELPFRGGALGYFGYDLARRIERLPERAADVTGMPEMAIGIYDWAVIVDHQEKRSLLVGYSRDAETSKRWEELIQQFGTEPRTRQQESFRLQGPVQSNLDSQAYDQAFEKVQHYIREGDCYQVNLARSFYASATGDGWELYRELRRVNPAPYSAFFCLPWGCVLSSSPERFLRLKGSRVETRPIKGTRPRGGTPEQDNRLAKELAQSEKDRAENVMIVDLLRNDIGRNCVPGSVEVPELFRVESFSGIHHLVSTVTGILREDRHAIDLLRGCFPGGSITGAPKVRAMEIIEELEPYRRSVYCGSLGYIGYDGGMDTNIAIRTLLYNGNTLRFWAGGGLVADSRSEAEYQETIDKVAVVLDLLERRAV